MRTNTGAALRVVEEIDDPQEIAQREAGQVTAEKAEIVAKLQELRSAKAEVDATVAAGDHRKIDDDLLDRGAKCERGIQAMERALEVAEAKRIEAEERVSSIARARAEVQAAAAVVEAEVRIAPATKAVEEAAHAFFKALEARGDAVVATSKAYSVAGQYGHSPMKLAETTKEVLERIATATGIQIDLRTRPR